MAKYKSAESFIKAVRAMSAEDVNRIETERRQAYELERKYTANRIAERENIVKVEQAKMAPYYEEFYKQQEIKKNGGTVKSTSSDLGGIQNPKSLGNYAIDSIKGLGLQELSKMMSMNANAIKYASPHEQQLLGLNNQKDLGTYIDTTDAVSNKFRVESNEMFEHSTDGWQGGKKVLGQVGNTVTRMVPNLATTILAGPLGGGASTFVGQKANKQNELLSRGIDRNQAELRGTLSGGVEAGIESSPIGTVGRFGDIIKVGSNGIKKIAKDVLLGATGEATEEGLTYVADYLLDKAFKDPEANFDKGEMVDTMKMAFLTGGIMDASGIAINKVNSRLHSSNIPINKPQTISINNQANSDVPILPITGRVQQNLDKNIQTSLEEPRYNHNSMIDVAKPTLNQSVGNLPLSESMQFDNAVKNSVDKIHDIKLKESAQRVLNVLKDKIFNNGKIMTFKEQLNSDKSRSVTTQPYLVKDVLINMPIEELNNKPVIISQNIVDKVRNQHGISDEILGDLDNLIQNPVAIVQSYSKDNEGKFLDAYMIFMDVKDHKDRLIQAVVYPQSLLGVEKLRVDSIGSIYGRDLNKTINQATINERNVWKKRSSTQPSIGLQLPKDVMDTTSISNISLPNEVVNGQDTVASDLKSQKIINYENKNFTNFSKYLQQNFGLSRTDVNTLLKNDVLGLKDSIQKTGKIDSNQAKAIFKKAWDFGVTKDTTMHDMYPELIAKLKSTSLNYDMAKRALGQNAFNDFRYESKGLLNINKDGGSIDSLYSELTSEYPNLFDPYIDNEGDQLNAMLDVASELQVTKTPLKDSNLRQFQSGYEEDFHAQLNQYLSFMERAEQIQRESKKKEPQGTFDYQTYKDNQTKIKALQREHDRVMREPFTQKELAYADMIINGKITINEVAEGVNKKTVQKIVDVKEPLFKIKAEIADAKKKIKYEYRALAREKTSNMLKWKDKKNGFLYNREIPERDLIDIAGKEDGQALVDTYIIPVHENEAARNRYINEKFNKIKELGLSKKESELLQQWGEKKIDDNKIIGEGYDLAKIKKADSVFRGIYDEVIELTNEALIKNGYAPIEKLDKYYRHFSETENTGFRKALEKLGFKWNSDNLPTNIAGLTDNFKPGKTWFSSALHRTGDKTVYDAVKGIETYIQNASDVIYHTDDIQRLRALESEIRYQYSDDYMKEQIDKAYESGETIEDVVNEVNKLTKDGKGNLATWLNQYTNTLSNKKLSGDRSLEYELGRGIYDFAKKVEGRVAANMVGINPASWLTNFIPITQATSQIKTKYLADAMNDTMKNYSTCDGFVDKSTFLTNRKGYDPLVQTSLEKAIDLATKPMTYVDDFTSQVVTRAKYSQNIAKGMDDISAMKDADNYAARLIGDRSKGAMPLIFEKKNPLIKLFTQFQLEVNNQMSYVLKDMKSYGQEEGAKALAMGLMKLCIGAWLYNNLTEPFTGRRAATDPIDIAMGAVSDFGNLKPGEALKNTSNNIIQEAPFIGGVMGGGRLPVANALPDLNNIFKYADAPENVQKDILKKEGLKSLYWVLPAGGGQIKKMVESGEVLANEGKYKQVSEGEQLQYPVKPTLGNAVKGALFGQYSFPEAREYFDEGNTPLSVKQTSGYRVAMREGIDSDLYLKAIEDIKAIESEKDDKGKTIDGSLDARKKAYIDSLKLNPFQKQLMYTNFDINLESKALKKYYEKNLKGMK